MPKTSNNESDEGVDVLNTSIITNIYGSSVDFSNSIVPTINSAFDLGSPSFFWQTGYISNLTTPQFLVPLTGPLTIKNHLLPDTDGSLNLGSPSQRFNNLYVANLNFSQISGNTFTSASGSLTLTTPTVNDAILSNRDFDPSVDNTYSLGAPTLRWKELRAVTVFSANFDNGGQPHVFNGSIRPINSGTYFVGSSDRRWDQGFINTLTSTTVNTSSVVNPSGDLALTTTSTSNSITTDRHVLPVTTGQTNLGSSTRRFQNVFANTIDVPSLAVNTLSSSSGNLLLTTPQTTELITVNRDLVPATNEANNLGVTGQRWNNVRAVNVVTNVVGNGASSLVFDSDVNPLVDSTKKLGTGTNRFAEANVVLANTTTLAADTLTTNTHTNMTITTANPTHLISITRSLLPASNGTQDLGSAALKFNNVYCNTINAPTFNVDTLNTATTTDLTLTTQGSSHTVKTTRNFTPTVTNTQKLGTSSLQWSQMYATTVFTGTVSNSGSPILFNGSLRPQSDNTFLLGTTSLRYQNGYIRNLFSDIVVETPQVRAGTASDLTLTTVTAGNSVISQRTVLPSTNNTLNLGSSGTRWATVFTTTLDATTLSINTVSSSSGNLTLTTAGPSDVVSLNRDLIPDTVSTRNLGNSVNTFANLYCGTNFINTLQPLSSTISVNATILPATGSTFNLGSTTARFATGFFDTLNLTGLTTPSITAPASSDLLLNTTTSTNKIVVAKSLLPNADNTLDLGATSSRFTNVYAVNVNASNYNANTISSASGDLLLTTPLSANVVKTNRNLTPATDNTLTLGTPSFRWSTLNAAKVVLGTLSNSNNPIALEGGFLPNLNNTHSLGSSSFFFQNTYSTNVYTGTIASTGTNDLLLTTPSLTQKVLTDRSLEPVTDNATTLGSTAKRFSNVHSVKATTGTLEAPSLSDLVLTCSSGSSYNIIANNNFNPTTGGSLNLGNVTQYWENLFVNRVNCASLARSSGSITTLNSIAPISNNTLNLGSTSLGFNTNFVNTISAASTSNLSLTTNSGTAVIRCNRSTEPSANGTLSLGSSSLQWLNGYILSIFGNRLQSNTSTDLTLSTTTAGNSIIFERSLLPPTDLGVNLGSTILRILNGFIRNLFATEISSTDSDLSLTTPSTSFYVIAKRHVLPDTDNFLDLGSSVKKWATVFANSLGNVSNYINTIYANTIYCTNVVSTTSQAYADLTHSGFSLSSTTYSKITMGVTVGPYDAGLHQISFPKVGLYNIVVNLEYDVDSSGTDNFIYLNLYRANVSNYFDNEKQIKTGNSTLMAPGILVPVISKTTLSWIYYCGSTSDRVEIRAKTQGVTVTNVKFKEGSRVYLIQAIS